MHSRVKCENCDGPADVIDNGTLCATCWLKRKYRNGKPNNEVGHDKRNDLHKAVARRGVRGFLACSQSRSDRLNSRAC